MKLVEKLIPTTLKYKHYIIIIYTDTILENQRYAILTTPDENPTSMCNLIGCKDKGKWHALFCAIVILTLLYKIDLCMPTHIG